MKKEQYHYKGEKLLDLLMKNKEFIGYIVALSGGLGYMYQYLYAVEAERFYGIHKSHFYSYTSMDYIMKCLLFFLVITVLFAPVIIKRTIMKGKCSLAIGSFFSLPTAFLIFSILICFVFLLQKMNYK